jgi:hypothetical protein
LWISGVSAVKKKDHDVSSEGEKQQPEEKIVFSLFLL